MATGWTPGVTTLRRAVLYRTALGFLLAALASVWGDIPPLDRLRLLETTAAIGVVVVLGLWVLYRLRRTGPSVPLAQALVLGDFLAVTLLVWLSGPVDGPLVFLYPLVVVSTSFLLGPGTSYYAAVAAFLLEGLGYLAMGGPSPSSALQELFLNGLLLIALAALADGLSNRLYRQEAQTRRRERDIQALTALAEEVLERVQTGLLVVDRQGRIQLSNPEAERLLLPGTGEATNSRLESRFPELYRLYENWRQGTGSANGEIQPPGNTDNQNNPHILAYRFTGLGDDPDSTLIHLQDLTAARERQRQQERIERLAAMGRLSANLAHEIRNPLSSIQQAGQLLTEQEANPRMTRIIRDEARRMNQWVETLLRHLRPPSGQLQTLELAPVVANAVRLLGSEDNWEDVSCFECQVPPGLTVCIDEGHLHQILWNLGVNALRHGQVDQDHPGIIRAEGTEEGRTRIEVLDSGPGISAEAHDRIFEPFYTTSPQGTGLGLGLVQELVEANHGTIVVANRTAGGARVTLELPERCRERG